MINDVITVEKGLVVALVLASYLGGLLTGIGIWIIVVHNTLRKMVASLAKHRLIKRSNHTGDISTLG